MTQIRGLGYLKVQTRHLDRWRELRVRRAGVRAGVRAGPEGLYLRMDERRSRLILLPGDTDRVLAVGWEVRDQFALAAVVRAVEASGTTVTVLSEEESAERDAEQVIAFRDPAGMPVEVFFGPVLDHSPVVTPLGQRFVTGAQGMGHVVVPTTAMEETVSFYTEVLGFLPRGAMKVGGGATPARRIRFIGVQPTPPQLGHLPRPARGRSRPGAPHGRGGQS